MATKKKAARHKQTIPPELYKQWRELARKGDPTELAEKLGVSKPTIDKALIYGCVHQQKIVDGITKFFEDRLIAEREAGNRLKELNQETKPDHSLEKTEA